MEASTVLVTTISEAKALLVQGKELVDCDVEYLNTLLRRLKVGAEDAHKRVPCPA